MWKNKAQAHFRMPRRVLLLFSARLFFCGFLYVFFCVFFSKLSQAQIFLSASCGIHLRFALPNSHNNNNSKTWGKVCGYCQRVLTSVKQWKWRQRQARAGRRRRHFRLTCVLSGSGSMLYLLPQSVCECVVCRCKYLCGCGTLVATLACHIATRLLCLLFFRLVFFSISPKQQQHLLSRPFPPRPCWAASGSLSDSTLRLFQLYLARF